MVPKMFPFKIVILSSFISLDLCGAKYIVFTLSGRSIAPESLGGDRSDPFVNLNWADGKCIGRTQTWKSAQNPDWSCEFMIDSPNRDLKMYVIDDEFWAPDPDIGYAHVFSDVIAEVGTYCIPIWRRSDLYMGEICVNTKSVSDDARNYTSFASCCGNCGKPCNAYLSSEKFVRYEDAVTTSNITVKV